VLTPQLGSPGQAALRLQGLGRHVWSGCSELHTSSDHPPSATPSVVRCVRRRGVLGLGFGMDERVSHHSVLSTGRGYTTHSG
jgi:hypothetical protein